MSNIAVDVCKACIERSEALGYKGKARDRYALDYIIAAAKGIELVNIANPVPIVGAYDKVEHLARIAWLVSVRGYSEVLEIAGHERKKSR